jgi:cellulose synthase/poly-beta-1,6-N-acetylglucosamine synthase-like glycosyltransferase
LLILFWVCFAVAAYVYIGYPLLLWLDVFGRATQRRDAHFDRRFIGGSGDVPLVSVIVAAHNEEVAIEAKILNLLASDFPRERLEILIGSDGSSDRTEEIVRRHRQDGAGLISFPKQQGKSAMQNGLVTAASGEILVFTDADCVSDSAALRLLVENFADPQVGLVTGAPRYANAGETSITENESTYLGYESWIRQEESRRGLLAMASGSLFAMRRSLWRPLDRNLGDDFELPLRTALSGMRNVLERRAVTVTRLSQNSAVSMFGLKSRIVSKDFKALMVYRAILNPFSHGSIALGLWSHKLLRWLAPYFLLGIFFSSAFLHSAFYRGLFLLQAAFGILAVLGFFVRGPALVFPWSAPTSFCVVNLAALVGVWRSLTGRASGRWTPVRDH